MTRSAVLALSRRRRHPAAALLVLLLGLVTLGGVYAVFAPTSEAGSSAASEEEVEAGSRLFAIGCSSCHGLGGEGATLADGTVLGPSLIGVGAASVDFQVSTGRMPAVGPSAQIPAKRDASYSQEQVRQLAAYVASLAPGPAIPNEEQYDPTLGDSARGGELYRANCAACHNTSGQGGALTEGKYAPSLTAVDPVHIYEAMLTGPQQMPVFSEDTLTSEDKRDIIAFLDSIREEPNPGGLGIGRTGPVSEGLWGWVVGIGGLIAAAVWIGAKSS
jgi:ubiquinol-cytochrome c reductase cytochrome c subunit